MEKIIDYVTNLEVNATPEEINAVQPYSKILVEDYGYPKENLITHPQHRVKSCPSDKKGVPVDIAVFDTIQGKKILKIIVECKKTSRKDGIDQLQDYLKFCEANIGVWYNGRESVYIKKIEKSGNIHFEEIPAIPKFNQKLSEIGLFKRKDLKLTHNLKNIFSDLKNYIAGNGVGVNRDEEIARGMINLMLCKIYDERFTGLNDMVQFRVSEDDTEQEVKDRIDKLFLAVKTKYKDVLKEDDTIEFDSKTLKHIIGKIQQYCITETDRDTIADAFEVFIGNTLKGEQGQFFTPKNVIKMMVAAVDPDLNDIIIDPASGSGGFLIESLKYLWGKLENKAKECGWNKEALAEEKKDIAIKNFKGIEKDSFLTKVSKSYMAILGDGKGGIFCEDSLDSPKNWNTYTQQQVKLNSFSISFSNPPFGKSIKVNGVEKLSQYELAKKRGKNSNEKLLEEANISTIFLERNLQLLKDGGILAIILPESYFHTKETKIVREFLCKHNIKWIIDLPHDTFRPHNNAKCLVIIVQKNMPQQKKINMAVVEYVGHDHNGNTIYVKDKEGKKTSEVLDDTKKIIEEINYINKNQQYTPKYTFQVNIEEVIKKDILIPRYYWKSKNNTVIKEAKKNNIKLVSIQQLINEEIIKCFEGNGSPSSELKGTGTYPYIRVKDIVNWQIYKDPTALLPIDGYEKLYKEEKKLFPKDILYVWRGSYRIGSVAMVSPFDLNVVLTREILVIRLLKNKNKYGLTPEYLLYALSHKLVYDQSINKIFIDTTLPTISTRWNELMIPIFNDIKVFNKISKLTKETIENQWKSLEGIATFKDKFGVYNT